MTVIFGLKAFKILDNIKEPMTISFLIVFAIAFLFIVIPMVNKSSQKNQGSIWRE